MFEISWSELLIFAVVTLIFVGPKELPAFLNTLGRYAGMVRRQAAEFRSHFEEAMREAEIDQMRKQVEGVRDDLVREVREADTAVRVEVEMASKDVAEAAAEPSAPALPAPENAGSEPAAAPTGKGA